MRRSRPCYLYNGNSYTGKTTSFYWIANTPPPPPPRTFDVEIILIIRKMDSLHDSNHFDIPGLHLCETVLEFSAYLKLILAMRPGFLKILKIFFHINPSCRDRGVCISLNMLPIVLKWFWLGPFVFYVSFEVCHPHMSIFYTYFLYLIGYRLRQL